MASPATAEDADRRGGPRSPAISVTICSRNRLQLLADTVDSILRGEVLPAEIVIVDQSDAPQPLPLAAEIPAACRIRHLHSRSRGVGAARNEAIRAARHDLLVLTDDDMLMAPSWLGELVRSLVEAGSRSVVTGRVLEARDADGGFAPSTKSDEEPRVYQGRIGRDVLYTGNMAMFRSTVEELGFFDERLGAGGRFPAAYDNDFGYRLLEAGYRILYVPEAVVHHRAWRPERDHSRLQFNYGRGQGAFYAKHLRLRDTHMLRRFGWTVTRHVLRLPARAVLRPKRVPGDVSFVLGLFSGAAEWLRTER